MKKIIITEEKLKKVILEQDGYFNIGDYDDTWESRIVDRGYNISGGRMFSPDYAEDEFGYHSCRSNNAYCFLFQYGEGLQQVRRFPQVCFHALFPNCICLEAGNSECSPGLSDRSC